MRFARCASFISVASVGVAAAMLLAAVASQAAELSSDVQASKAALAKYQDPVAAIRDGYFSTLACVQFASGGTLNGMQYPAGGMGVHFLNPALVGTKLDPTHPQVLLYKQAADGTLTLAGAEWFVPYQKGMKPPRLFDHTFYGPMMGHYPVMAKQAVHYDLHVWLWLPNPNGMFTPTNANLKCPNLPYTYTLKTPTMPEMPSAH
jgi:hypothetical protein